jgi:transketolase
MDEKIINNIKTLAIDMIQEAGSGHPGIVLGAAPILYTLYAKHMRVSTSDTSWVNRDRFVLSAGHGSALLYATLYMAGFNLSLEDLKRFRHYQSKVPGHPEVFITPGVEASTGPLGQGIATAVGLALGEKMLKERVNTREYTLIDYYVYALCGDGDFMEGISYEAMSFAGSHHLDNLIVLYDSNGVSLDGVTDGVFNESMEARAKSMGWDYEFVKDGTQVSLIDKAISRAKLNKKPTLIEVKTIIGKGSYLEGSNAVHGKLLTDDDIKQLKYNLGIPLKSFYVDENVCSSFRRSLAQRTNTAYMKWADSYKKCASDEETLKKIAFLFNPSIRCNFLDYDFHFEEGLHEAIRSTNKKIMDVLSSYIPYLIGGAADVASSTNAYLQQGGDVTHSYFLGKNIHYGIREHAMGAISNGLALSHFRTFASTFFCFSDYLKPAIRMSALMHLPVIYIFSHDSILVGQDGPTHQPIEQLASFRSMPDVVTYRPCDANELVGAWNTILNDNIHPSILVLSRTEVPLLSTSNKHFVEKGGYIIKKEVQRLDATIIATGTEVSLAISLANVLYKENQFDIRVVSMPSMNLFDKQTEIYQKEVLGQGHAIFTLEAGSTYGWDRYATDKRHMLGIDTFGASGTKEEVLKATNFDFETLKKRIVHVLEEQKIMLK